ncbi:MAG TPA: glutamate mutase L [Anaerolineales bacterium]|nr:glutamate mutase L [Anaerolineales bacterium]
MTTAPTDSILAADIGSITARVALFDIVSGEFRFVASGEARSTAEPPFSYMGEGLHQAMEHLKILTGRTFMDDNDRLIMPIRMDGSGIDAFAASASGGKPLRVALAGLMPNISLASAERVALSAHVIIVDRMGLGDRRKPERQIDDLINAKPEVVIIAGGTDYGSQGAVLKLADTVAMAARRMREGTRPEILFVGNAALHEKIKDMFTGLCDVGVAENLRPVLNEENITSARRQLARVYERVRLGTMAGYGELSQWTTNGVTPNATAFGNLVHHMSQTTDSGKGLLAVDVGSASTTLAAAIGGDISVTVRADLGVGHSAAYLTPSIDRLSRWLPEAYPDGEVRDYIANKSLAPATVPYELRELFLEHALARQCMQNVLQSAAWPAKLKGIPGLLPSFDTIIGSGAVLARAPKPGQAALMLLDGLQPTGIVTLVLDSHSLMPLLGAASALNPVAVVQALDAGALSVIGTAVCLVGDGRPGQEAVRVKATVGDQKIDRRISFGSLELIHLPPERDVKVSIQPSGAFDAGFGRGASKSITIQTGAVGLIVDARGRPIGIPTTADKRHGTVSKWCANLGEYSS